MVPRPCGLSCPYCYAGVKARSFYPGHVNGIRASTDKRREKAMAIKRREEARTGGPAQAVVGDCPLRLELAHLWEFLCLTVYDDGSPRTEGTMLVTASDGRVRVWLNDKDAELSCWVSGSTLLDALETANEGLGGDCLEWRAAKPRPGPTRKK